MSGASAKLIGFFAPATLSVYLIHVHPFVFEYLLKDAFVSFANMNAVVSVIVIFIATLAIFVICSLLDLLRIQAFKFIRIGKLCEFIENKLTNIYSKVFKA